MVSVEVRVGPRVRVVSVEMRVGVRVRVELGLGPQSVCQSSWDMKE